jgi:hypothetical protein
LTYQMIELKTSILYWWPIIEQGNCRLPWGHFDLCWNIWRFESVPNKYYPNDKIDILDCVELVSFFATFFRQLTNQIRIFSKHSSRNELRFHSFQLKSMETGVMIAWPDLIQIIRSWKYTSNVSIKGQLNSNFTQFFLESVHFSKSEWQ